VDGASYRVPRQEPSSQNWHDASHHHVCKTEDGGIHTDEQEGLVVLGRGEKPTSCIGLRQASGLDRAERNLGSKRFGFSHHQDKVPAVVE